MSGFTNNSDGDLNRIFFTEYELIDQYVGEKLWSWGYNGLGQLGDGTTTERRSPVITAGGGTNWKLVSSGKEHTAAIKTDGTLWTWGQNNVGQLGNGNLTQTNSPASISGGGTNWTLVSCGDSTTVAIKTDGTLWNWGIVYSAVATSSPVTVVGGGTNWKTASVGISHTAAIKTDGSLWTWGVNDNGQLGDGSQTARSSPGTTAGPAGGGTTWKSVSASYVTTAAIKTDGTLWTWGFNSDGKLGSNNGSPRSSPNTTSGGGTTWKSVSCGEYHMAAIKTDGTLWTWGRNDNGQLGNGGTTPRSSPGTTAGGGTTWKSVSCCGLLATAAIKTDGTLWTWGNNSFGILGTGDTTARSSPGTNAGAAIDWKSVPANNSYNQYNMSAIGY